ncbi:hypothetical protein KDH_48780 [Dictyobacter sp. S3.2.2.5]|uniref:Transmembrane protein n=1 Tax=Dictyobacter halimunensis TaxID=3026934 RepID=A0ABQ6FUV1_9CHLR|nr:hypothetical protein KDH_48780 [Dictyobacter sp. S3.2.2.5]
MQRGTHLWVPRFEDPQNLVAVVMAVVMAVIVMVIIVIIVIIVVVVAQYVFVANVIVVAVIVCDIVFNINVDGARCTSRLLLLLLLLLLLATTDLKKGSCRWISFATIDRIDVITRVHNNKCLSFSRTVAIKGL